MMTSPLMTLDSVNKAFSGQHVLQNISLQLNHGEITTLIGPNGAGKSTLVRIVLGLLKPDSGSVLSDANLKIGYMPQKLHIDPTLPISTCRFLQLANASHQACHAALESVGIAHLAATPIQKLSGGEMQRALLARAILRKPNLLVLDEPVQGVDVNGQNALYKMIGDLSKSLNCAVLMVSHDLHIVMSATDQVVCLTVCISTEKAATMIDFILYALLAGLGVALVAGPLGCFVVWRRMAYFGDTLAHSALLGVALGVLLEVNLSITVTVVPLTMALGLVLLEQRGFLSLDTLLGILSHSALAAGLVVISLLPDVRVDLMSLLFGDLLSVTPEDLWVIYGVAGLVLVLLGALWKQLINITVDPELAAVEGTNVALVRTALMLITALVIAIAMKIVGVLLITALLIIPAATARRVSHTPEQMAIAASVIAMITVVMGLALSWTTDAPAGPSVVLCAALLFMVSLSVRQRV